MRRIVLALAVSLGLASTAHADPVLIRLGYIVPVAN